MLAGQLEFYNNKKLCICYFQNKKVLGGSFCIWLYAVCVRDGVLPDNHLVKPQEYLFSLRL